MKMFKLRFRRWRLYFNPAARKYRRELEDWMNSEPVQKLVKDKTLDLMTMGAVEIKEKDLSNSG